MGLAPAHSPKTSTKWHEPSRTEPRWISAIDDRVARETRLGWILAGGSIIVLGAWLASRLSLSSTAFGLTVLAIWLVALGWRRRSGSLHLERRGLSITRTCVFLATGPEGTRRRLVLALDRPFGLTLLCNPSRRRVVLAVTTLERTLYLGAAISPSDRQDYAAFLVRACTVGEDDPVLDAIAPDGRPLELGLEDLVHLWELLKRHDCRAESRCFLSDTQGNAVVLDGDELRIGCHQLNLAFPIEWHALWFQEATCSRTWGASDADPFAVTGGAATNYQATWIRQGSVETVLVALLPPQGQDETGADSARMTAEVPELAEALARDERLMHAVPAVPPPRELRVGIERTYMLPLRAALDRASRSRSNTKPLNIPP